MDSCKIYLSREINDPKYKQERDEIENQAKFWMPFKMDIPHYKEEFQNFRDCGVDAAAIVNETEQAIYQRAEYIKEMHQNVLRALGEKNEELRSTENIEVKEKAIKKAKQNLRTMIKGGWNPPPKWSVAEWMVKEGERIYKKQKGERDLIEFEAFKNNLMAENLEQKMLVAADIVRILTDFTKVPKEMIKMSQRYPRPVNNQKVMSQMELGKKEEKEEGEEEEHPFVDGMVGDKRKRNSSPNSNQPNTPPKKKKSIEDDRKKEDAPEGGSKRKKRKSRKKRHKRHKTLKGKKKKKRKSRKKRHKTLKGKKS